MARPLDSEAADSFITEFAGSAARSLTAADTVRPARTAADASRSLHWVGLVPHRSKGNSMAIADNG